MRLLQPLKNSFGALLAALNRVADSIEQRNKAENERKDSYQKEQVSSDILRLRDAVESIANSQRAAHGAEHWYKDPTFWVSLIGVAIVAIYTSITAFMWHDANRNFVVNQRAWIGVSRPVSITSITYDKSKYTITYVVTLKNYGPSVALHEYLSTRAVTDIVKIREQMQEACNEASYNMNQPVRVKVVKSDKSEVMDSGGQMGQSIFPSEEPGTWYNNITFDASPGVFVVGCSAYKDEFGMERHTRFCHYGQLYSNDITQPLKTPIFMYPFIGYNDAD